MQRISLELVLTTMTDDWGQVSYTAEYPLPGEFSHFVEQGAPQFRP